MAARSEYTVDIGGIPHTLLLTEQEAERADGVPKRKARAEVPNKARKPVHDKSATKED